MNEEFKKAIDLSIDEETCPYCGKKFLMVIRRGKDRCLEWRIEWTE